MLVVNKSGTLIHVILENSRYSPPDRIPIKGVTTQKNYDSLSEGYKLSTLHYNKKIKWLYK